MSDGQKSIEKQKKFSLYFIFLNKVNIKKNIKIIKIQIE